MPKIDFNFSGFVRGAIIIEATETATGNKVDVRNMSGPGLERKLNSGELCISLGDHLYDSRKTEVEMVDFEATPCWPDEA